MMVLTDKKQKKYELRHKYDGLSKEDRDKLTTDLRRKRKRAHEKRRIQRRRDGKKRISMSKYYTSKALEKGTDFLIVKDKDGHCIDVRSLIVLPTQHDSHVKAWCNSK